VDEVQRGKVQSLELIGGPFERPIGILTRKRAELSLPAQKFIELLVAAPKIPPGRQANK